MASLNILTRICVNSIFAASWNPLFSLYLELTQMRQELAFRNCRWRLHGQWCRLDEIQDWRLIALLTKYGMIFLDDYYFILLKKSKWTSVYRLPIWETKASARMEKYKRKDKAQTKLLLAKA